MKILIAGGGTGGHLMPALALARAAAAAGHEPVMVGAVRGIEAQILPSHPFRYYLLPLEPIYRRTWWRNLRWPLTLWRVWRATARMLDVERPRLAIGTGGYAAGPALWFAARRGIPIVLQEPDAHPGLTTRFLAAKARQVHLGFPEARARLRLGPGTEVFALGNPITPPQVEERSSAIGRFGLDPARPTVFLFGGSQGARALNEALAGAIASGRLGAVNVLWGTGTGQYERYASLARAGSVCVRGFFDPIAPAYAAADVVVSRAGAMTIAELCAWGKPSVLIPLPTAAADHQTFNARALAAAGAAVMLPERELSASSLVDVITKLVADRGRLASLSDAALTRGHPDAARAIMSKILTLVS
ncbi:MAG TPA: undecaprenyldiphospho-muramoylpentapeptide beta-N-acetylglucosaminyltransferase [Gemmatimonadales bacterium]|nr:undecaprenyldiphospho-muramoylpentapeptide beta-N-acetylglucosaminyltransferase [Gemmatimonadales bacterium]